MNAPHAYALWQLVASTLAAFVAGFAVCASLFLDPGLGRRGRR